MFIDYVEVNYLLQNLDENMVEIHWWCLPWSRWRYLKLIDYTKCLLLEYKWDAHLSCHYNKVPERESFLNLNGGYYSARLHHVTS